MTEKRFWYDFEDCDGPKIVDFKEDKEYPLETIGDFRDIENLLNELADENQELNKHINSSVQYIDAIIEANECEIRWATNNNVDCSFAKYVNEELEKIKRRINND